MNFHVDHRTANISKYSNMNGENSSTVLPLSYERRRMHQDLQQLSSSTSTTSHILTIDEKQTDRINIQHKVYSKARKSDARPLGIGVRKCDHCRQFKHILIAECPACSRTMDVDLYDCKCQSKLKNKNVLDHFNCSTCDIELMLDKYIICANRQCQTTLSALISKETKVEMDERSIEPAIVTDVQYSKSANKTVAIQVNTLDGLKSFRRSLLNNISNASEEPTSLSSSTSSSADSSIVSYSSSGSNASVFINYIAKNKAIAFNSNQPSKFTFAPENQDRPHQSRPTNIDDRMTNQDLSLNETPKSPRCLAIMNVYNRRNRLSTLLKLKRDETCQTSLSCLIDIDATIRCDEIVDPIIIMQSDSPSHVECQIQVDTIKGRCSEFRRDVVRQNLRTDPTNDERVLQAIVDKDGQRWSKLIDLFIHERSGLSLSQLAQQLLDTIERLHTSKKLNSLTNGQLQRRVRYAMSQLKYFDEQQSRSQHTSKAVQNNRTNIDIRNQVECHGAADMTVTVRQIDQHHHNRQPPTTRTQHWKSYVDRLFDQGCSADDIRRLLHEAAGTTMQFDNYRLQDVFNYIDTKAKLATQTQHQPKTLFECLKPTETVHNRDMHSSGTDQLLTNRANETKSKALSNKNLARSLDEHKPPTDLKPPDKFKTCVNVIPSSDSSTTNKYLSAVNSEPPSKQYEITSEYQDTTTSMECHQISNTLPDETRPPLTSEQEDIRTKDFISLTRVVSCESFVKSQNDFYHIHDKCIDAEKKAEDHLSTKEWLDHLLSKLSNNVHITSNISLTPSPCLLTATTPDVDGKDKEQETETLAVPKPTDKQIPLLSQHPSLVQVANMIEVPGDSQHTQCFTRVIMSKKEHAISIIAPMYIFAMIDEGHQLVRTAISQQDFATSSTLQQIETGGMQPVEEIAKSNLTVQHAPPVSFLITNSDENKNLSVHDKESFKTDRSTSSTNVDEFETSEQCHPYEESVSEEYGHATDASKYTSNPYLPEKQIENEIGENPSQDIALSQLEIEHAGEGNTKSVPSNEQEEENVTSVSWVSSNDNEYDNLIETSEPLLTIENAHEPTFFNSPTADQYSTRPISSILFIRLDKINEIQLPISIEHTEFPNFIQINSSLIQLKEKFDIDNEEVSEILSVDHKTAEQQAASLTFSSSQDTNNETMKYKNMGASSSSSPELTSLPMEARPSDDDAMAQYLNTSYDLGENSSKSMTSLKGLTKNERSNAKDALMKSDFDVPVPNIDAELNVFNEANRSLSANTSKQFSSSHDDITNISQAALKTTKYTADLAVDDSQLQTQSVNEDTPTGRQSKLIDVLPRPSSHNSLSTNLHNHEQNQTSQTRMSHQENSDVNDKHYQNQQTSAKRDKTIHSPRILSSTSRISDGSSSGKLKQRSTLSTTVGILPSSFVGGDMRQVNTKSSLNNSLTLKTKDFQQTKQISSSNIADQKNQTLDGQYKYEDENSIDKNLHFTSSTSRLPLTNGPFRNNISSTSTPTKLLHKRPSMKQKSTTIQTAQSNSTMSITGVSASSSSTITSDHVQRTLPKINNHENTLSSKQPKREINSDEEFIIKSDSTLKNKVLKTSATPPSHKQSSTRLTQRRQHRSISKTLFRNKSLMPKFEISDNLERKSDRDTRRIRCADEENEKNSKVNQRHSKKQNKIKICHTQKSIRHTIQGQKRREQAHKELHLKKLSKYFDRRRLIRLPVTQIEKFECGTIGPRYHPYAPSVSDDYDMDKINDSLTDRFYSLMSTDNIDDRRAFESIIHWQQQKLIPAVSSNKFQHVYILNSSMGGSSVRGKQYPIVNDEIDLIDDPNACTVVNEWAFADLVKTEREKFVQDSNSTIKKSKEQSNRRQNIKICLRKRPLTDIEEKVLKEVDIISIADAQNLYLHIPSITIDNQVFIKNQKFKCDQTFHEHCHISTIYQSTLTSLLDRAIDGGFCLCLIGGGKHSGKTYLLHSLTDLLANDLIRLLSSYDIYVRLLGVCHNRIIDLLQDYSPIHVTMAVSCTLETNDLFHVETVNDVNYIIFQIRKRRRFIHQFIQINFYHRNTSITIGSLLIIVLASSQYVYTRSLCSQRRKFLINSLNKTVLSLKRALLCIRQNPERVRAAFNNDILTRLMQPYIFHDKANVCYIGTLHPGHRHRIATKSTIEFARNLLFCLKRINKQRRTRKRLFHINSYDNNAF